VTLRRGVAGRRRDAYVRPMSDRSPYEPRRPVEPEIIPPGEPLRRERRGDMWIRVSRGSHFREVHIRRPGLIHVIAGALVVGLATALVLAVLVSVFLVWIPIVGLILAGLILAGLLRGWRRPG
jgi:hypothetical protein